MRRHWLGLCMLGLAAPTWAVPMVIVSDATFVVENTDPPLSGPGSWSFRSQPFDPTDPEDPNPNPETFEILDFAFSFAGHSWDETDAIFCNCEFTAEGDPLGVHFTFDDGTVSWILGFSFHDGVFGFVFDDGVVSISPHENPQFAPGDYNFSIVPAVVPEPGTLALLGLGLLGFVLMRRKAASSPLQPRLQI